MDAGGSLGGSSHLRRQPVAAATAAASTRGGRAGGRHGATEQGLCKICGDEIGPTADGQQLFAACNTCGYPVCRPCYEYERRDGQQACPQCKTRYAWHEGSPNVMGDSRGASASAGLELPVPVSAQELPQAGGVRGSGRGVSDTSGQQEPADSHYQLYREYFQENPLQHRQLDERPDGQPYEQNGFGGTRSLATESGPAPAKRGSSAAVHPVAFPQSPEPEFAGAEQLTGIIGQSHGSPGREPQTNEERDLANYGYGDIAWKDRIDSWKQRQQKMGVSTERHCGVGRVSGRLMFRALALLPPVPPTQAGSNPAAGWGQMAMTEGNNLDDGNGGSDDPEDPAGVGKPPSVDEGRQPLSRKVDFPSALINPYRVCVALRLVILGFFFRYRLTNPVHNAYGLWLTAVICELWFAFAWILDQAPKWMPVNRETYLDRLQLRYEKDGESQLAPVDIFVSTVDPLKEPPLATMNTILSILAMEYPVDRLSVYVSDDGASMLTFEALSETSEFSRKWVPFCKKYNVEPRAPEVYFVQKLDYLKDKVQPTFVKDRRAIKREYEEWKVRINAIVAKAAKVPEEGWTMQDGTPWPGNNNRDHPGMIQVFLGASGGHDASGQALPRLVYVAREKRPGYNHHKKAGAMNALVRVSAVLTNAPYILNLDCDHYINNSRAVREAMCFMMDPALGRRVCFVQFPLRYDGIDRSDRYANHNTVFFDINLRCLDGIQGPVYVGTGCCFRRQALYAYSPPLKKKKKAKPRRSLASCCMSLFCCCRGSSRRSGVAMPLDGKGGKEPRKQKADKDQNELPIFQLDDFDAGDEEEFDSLMAIKRFERRFGQSPVFVLSTFHEDGGNVTTSNPSSILKEAIHVISCGYEEKTEWGKEVGWIYGPVTEDILTGFKMHVRGWRSIYCIPDRPAFKGSAPINLADRLNQVLRWSLGSVEIFLSKHCPIWFGWGSRRLKLLQRVAYINTAIYPFTSLPLVTYCTLPAVCLLTDKFIIPQIGDLASIWFIALFLSILATAILEMRWSGVGLEEWWRNEQFWVIGGVSSHLYAVMQGLLKVLGGIDTHFTVTAKAAEDNEFGELYAFKWTALLIPPTTLLIINIVGIVAGIANAINNGVGSGTNAWGSLLGKLFFAFWVIFHLYPFLKGLMGKHNRTPTIVIVWAVLLASAFSLLWIHIDPFLPKYDGPNQSQCGIRC
eukprot:SM000013S26579  [mRNA]  locus=s13:1237127:1242758:+ [translate_table: standard]